MKKSVTVVTEDLYLFQKIYLILKPHAEVKRISASEASSRESEYWISLINNVDIYGEEKICLWDTESIAPPAVKGGITFIGREEALTLPFSEEDLKATVLGSRMDGRALLRLGDRCAYLRGRHIKLTEVEFALLSGLASAKGGFVSRERLIKAVWGEDTDGGVLNVYIHYLREKLEKEGEKIILSSRKQGYKIDEKYLKEGVEC